MWHFTYSGSESVPLSIKRLFRDQIYSFRNTKQRNVAGAIMIVIILPMTNQRSEWLSPLVGQIRGTKSHGDGKRQREGRRLGENKNRSLLIICCFSWLRSMNDLSAATFVPQGSFQQYANLPVECNAAKWVSPKSSCSFNPHVCARSWSEAQQRLLSASVSETKWWLMVPSGGEGTCWRQVGSRNVSPSEGRFSKQMMKKNRCATKTTHWNTQHNGSSSFLTALFGLLAPHVTSFCSCLYNSRSPLEHFPLMTHTHTNISLILPIIPLFPRLCKNV